MHGLTKSKASRTKNMATWTCACGGAIALGLILFILDLGLLVSHVEVGSLNGGFDIATIVLCLVGDVAIVAAVTARENCAIRAAIVLRSIGVFLTLIWRIETALQSSWNWSWVAFHLGCGVVMIGLTLICLLLAALFRRQLGFSVIQEVKREQDLGVNETLKLVSFEMHP